MVGAVAQYYIHQQRVLQSVQSKRGQLYQQGSGPNINCTYNMTT